MAVDSFARERRLRTPEAPAVGPGRIGSHLTAVVSVRLDRPGFEGTHPRHAGRGPVRDCVREAVQEHTAAWLRKDPAAATALLTGADAFPGSGGPGI